MVRALYQCEVCGAKGTEKEQMELHEKIPITGLKLEPGQIFKYHYFGKDVVQGRQPEGFDFLVIAYQNPLPTHEHLLQYTGAEFRAYVSKDQPIRSVCMSRICPVIDSDRRLEELTEDEFKAIIEIFKKSGSPGEMSIYQIYTEHNHRELKRGVIKK